MGLPLRRTYLDRDMQRCATVFQFGTRKPRDDYKAMSLWHALGDSDTPLLGYATGAPLTELEFDVLTLLKQWLRESGCSDDGVVRTSLTQIGTLLYGRKPTTTERARIAEALDRLVVVTVTLPGFDLATGTISPEKYSRANLLEGFTGDIELERFWAALKRGEGAQFSSVGKLKGKGSLTVVLPRWIVSAVRAGEGYELDFDAQTSLTGVAKNVWVALQGLPYAESDDEPEEETHRLDLTEDNLSALGLNHAELGDRRIALRKHAARIKAADPTFLSLSIERDRSCSSRFAFQIVRCTGEKRQARLRRRLAELAEERETRRTLTEQRRLAKRAATTRSNNATADESPDGAAIDVAQLQLTPSVGEAVAD